MAYLRDLHEHRCRCGKPARVELVNKFNRSMGYFCKVCGRSELRAAEARERQPANIANDGRVR